MSELGSIALLTNAASTFYMVGLLWFVQRVHYPLFAEVGADAFPGYERAHVSRTGPVVGPPMLLELGSAGLMVFAPARGVPSAAVWLGLALLAVIWGSTALLQVPRHRELESGFGDRAHRRLVTSNWIRTIAWSLRGGLVLWMLFQATTLPAR